MSGRLQLRPSSIRRQRALARVPQIVLLCAICLLALVGVHTAVAGHATVAVRTQPRVADDLATRAFAESFARAYLSWDAEHPEQRERALRGYVSDALDPGAGLSVPNGGSREVEWTTVTGDTPAGGQQRTITVAAEVGGRIRYLSIPVARDGRGRLYLAGHPALVGGPATTTHAEGGDEPELEDGQLRAVVSRALSNYLAREGEDLRADLDQRAVVSLPPQPLRLRSLDALTQPRPGWVAARVLAVDRDGADLTLRYELQMVRRDRWYVRSIGPDPTGRSTR